MAYFQSEKIKTIPLPIPDDPPYNPPTPPTPDTPEQGSDIPIPRTQFVGGIHITFYHTSDDNNVLSKALTQITTLEIAYNENVDVLNPSIIIQTSASLTGCNMVYIRELSRYYFVNKITLLNGNMYRIDLHVDVLMTYKNQIKRLDCIIERSESLNLSNRQINDNMFVNESDEYIQRYIFNTDSSIDGFLSNPVHILICAGGEG